MTSPYFIPIFINRIPYFSNFEFKILCIINVLVFGLQEMSAVNLDETGFKAIAGALLDNRNVTFLDISSKNFFKTS